MNKNDIDILTNQLCDAWEKERQKILDIKVKNDLREQLRLRSIDPTWDEFFETLTVPKDADYDSMYFSYIDGLVRIWGAKDKDDLRDRGGE